LTGRSRLSFVIGLFSFVIREEFFVCWCYFGSAR
jgi:hypothetical protein